MISRRSSQHDDNEVKSAEADIRQQIQSISRRPYMSARMIAPFVAAHDIPRGAIHALQALLSYAFMMAIM